MKHSPTLRLLNLLSMLIPALLLTITTPGCGRTPMNEDKSTQHLIDELREAIRSGESRESEHVTTLVRSLAGHGNEAIAPVSALLDTSDIPLAEAAADVLETIGTERAYDSLVSYAVTVIRDPSGMTKLPGPGRKRLLRLGSPIVPSMIRAFSTTNDRGVRLAMLGVVSTMKDSAALPMIDAALAGGDELVAEAAAGTLGAIGGSRAYSRLLELLGSENVQIELGAIQGLAYLGDQRAVGPLSVLLQRPDRPYAPSWEGQSAEPKRTIHAASADAIDRLTGESLNGDPKRINDWLEHHK